MTYDSILVPTDGSDHADRATAHALSLASAFDATVHALGVVDIARLAGPFDAGGVDQSFIDRYQEQAQEDVRHVENQWAQPDRFQGDVRNGPPAAVIDEYITDEGIDLVAMGTHGRTGLKRFVLGSVTEHVLRTPPVPILATRAGGDDPPTLPYRDILVPTDGSDCANAAVDHALSIARACDATVHAINVIDTEIYPIGPGGQLPVDVSEPLKQSGQAAVEAVADRADSAGVTVDTALVNGRPSDTIRTYATEHSIDLIVMGTHGRSGLDRMLLGSTTERVIRQSELPTVAVPE